MKRQLSDLDINRAVRRVLVKHWIDLGRVAVRASQGRLAIYGDLHSLPGTKQRLRPESVKAIFDEIQRINGVTRVNARLDNWTNDGSMWKACEAEGGTPGLRPPLSH